LQIIRIYAQSVLCIRRHNGLDTMPLPDSRINKINDRLMKRHSLINYVFKLISQVYCCLLFLP